MRRLWLLPPVFALAGLSVYVMVLSRQIDSLSQRAIANEAILAQNSLLPIEEDARCSTRQHSYGLIDEESLLASIDATHTDLAIPEEIFIGACEYQGTTYQLFDRTGLEFDSANAGSLGDSWAVAMSTDAGWQIINFTASDTSADSPQCYFSDLFTPSKRGDRETLHIDCESVRGGATLGSVVINEAFVFMPQTEEVVAWYACISDPIVVTTPDGLGAAEISNITCTSEFEQVIE